MRVLAYPLGFPKRAHATAGKLVACFRRSAYLELGRRRTVVALVSPELGCGPLSVVVDGLPWGELQVGDGVRVTPDSLRVADLHLDMQGARAWDPALPRVVPGREAVLRCLAWLVERAPSESLAAVLPHLLEGCGPPLAAWQRRGLEGLGSLQAGRDASAARALCGLGPGLTPSGDDALCGWMLACRLLGRPTAHLLRAARATSRISRAYLQASARGHASEVWHRLVVSLEDPRWEAAAEAVVAVGETSGADTLAGFLLGLRSLRP